MEIKKVEESFEVYSVNDSFTILKVIEEDEKATVLESAVDQQG